MSTDHTIGYSSKSLLPTVYNNNSCFQQASEKAITCAYGQSQVPKISTLLSIPNVLKPLKAESKAKPASYDHVIVRRNKLIID